jgi:hypothetical protein
MMTQVNQSNELVMEALNLLIDQVGRLTEGITEVRLVAQDQNRVLEQLISAQIKGFADIKEGFTEVKQIAQAQNQAIAKLADAQAETARTQAESVSRLIALLERRETV